MGSTARIIGLAAVVLIVASAAAGQDSRQIVVGGEDTVTASVSNTLDVPDVLVVEFDGPAVTRGIVDVALPETGPRLQCTQETQTCRVMLPPGEERQLRFSIEGASPGSDTFMVRVSSQTTGKRSEAALSVTVEERERSGSILTMLRRLLGMS